MARFQIATDSFGENALFPRRDLTVGDKTISTPTKSVSVSKTREHEDVRQDARGVAELYRTISTNDIRERRSGESPLTEKFQSAVNKLHEDELACAFLSYQETGRLTQPEREYLVDVLDTVSDILTVPLMPKLLENIDAEDGVSSPAYQDYKHNAEAFLETAEKFAPETPKMAVVPALGRDFVDDLMQVYSQYGVQAYCLNMRRRRITAARWVGMVRPLMRYVANRGEEERVIFYGINLHPGETDDALGARPAADIAGLGMGLDIIGENHVSPSMPSEVFEAMEESGDETIFTLFDREDFVRREIPLSDLSDQFPDESAFEGSEVLERSRASDQHRRRLEKLVNAEQMALAAADLRPHINSNDVYQHVSGKPGIPPTTLRSYQSVREDFDAGREQTGLGEF